MVGKPGVHTRNLRRLLNVALNLGTNSPPTEPRSTSPKPNGTCSISVLSRVQVDFQPGPGSQSTSQPGVIGTMATGKTSASTTALLDWGQEVAVPTTGVILKWFSAPDRMFLA